MKAYENLESIVTPKKASDTGSRHKEINLFEANAGSVLRESLKFTTLTSYAIDMNFMLRRPRCYAVRRLCALYAPPSYVLLHAKVQHA